MGWLPNLRPLWVALRPALKERVLLSGLVAGAVCYAVPNALRIAEFEPALKAIGSRDFLLLLRVALFLVIYSVGLGVGGYAMEACRRTLQDRLIMVLRVKALSNLLGLSMGFHDASRLGEITNRLTTDIEYTRGVLRVALGNFLQAPIKILALGALAAIKTGWLALLLIPAIPIMVVPILLYGRALRQRERASLEADAELTQSFHQALSGIRQVKTFAAETAERERLGRDAAVYRDRKDAVIQTEARNTGMTEGLWGVAGGALLAAVGAALWAEWVTLGEAVIFAGVMVALYLPVRSLTKGFIVLQEAIAGLERVLELCEPGPSVADAPNATPLPGFAQGIRLEGVDLTYPDGTTALRGVNLEVKRGETVVVTGPSGAGKSTLLDLLLRVHDASAGAVRFDGTDVREVTRASLCALMGVVTQDPFLFHDTIADNIRYGRPEADDAAVEEAARAANIHDEIADLPEGYQTIVGERGVRLSGGQRQRITVARAILRDTPILLLDEPLAAVDPAGRNVVEEALERLRAGRTTVAITHDLRGSLVTKADRIAVIADGTIAEQGSFEELSARESGLFRDLLRRAEGTA
jgi:ABC-type multidrug transport system fused ATPase/permease subunit